MTATRSTMPLLMRAKSMVQAREIVALAVALALIEIRCKRGKQKSRWSALSERQRFSVLERACKIILEVDRASGTLAGDHAARMLAIHTRIKQGISSFKPRERPRQERPTGAKRRGRQPRLTQADVILVYVKKLLHWHQRELGGAPSVGRSMESARDALWRAARFKGVDPLALLDAEISDAVALRQISQLQSGEPVDGSDRAIDALRKRLATARKRWTFRLSGNGG